MDFKIKNKVGARFKLIAHKGDGVPTRETEWFNNLVLDTGLDRMGTGNWIDRCCVGTGNSTPLATQISLDSFLASTTSSASENKSVNTSIEPFYWAATKVWRFKQGVAAGNISEVGMGWSDSNLWNRALIRDLNGNPTTITVLSDEYLDVVAEVRIYPPTGSGSFELKDKNGNVLSIHIYNYKPFILSSGWYAAKVQLGSTSDTGQNMALLYSDAMGGSVTTGPMSLVITKKATQIAIARGCRAEIEYSLSEANAPHRSFILYVTGLMSVGNGLSGIQLEMSPPITKLNTQVMKYTFEMTWGRYEPA